MVSIPLLTTNAGIPPNPTITYSYVASYTHSYDSWYLRSQISHEVGKQLFYMCMCYEYAYSYLF